MKVVAAEEDAAKAAEAEAQEDAAEAEAQQRQVQRLQQLKSSSRAASWSSETKIT